MNIKTFLFAVLCICMSTAAQAQTVEFRGGGVMKFQRNACTNDGWPGQGGFEYINVRYRPANVGGNGSADRLSVFFQFAAMNFNLDNGRFNNTFKDTNSVYLYSGAGQELNPRTRGRSRGITPNNITPNTQSVRIKIQLRNFSAVQGCDVLIDAPLFKRP